MKIWEGICNLVQLNVEGLVRILILFFPVLGLVVFAYDQTSAELLIEIGGLSQAGGHLNMLAAVTRGLLAIPLFMLILAEAFWAIGEEIVICEHERVGWRKSLRAACSLMIISILIVSFCRRGNVTPMDWLLHMIQLVG